MTSIATLFFGAVIIAAVVLMPHGLMDLARRARLRTLTWRYLGENVRANKL